MSKVAYKKAKERYTNYDLLFCLYDTELAKEFNLKPTTFLTLGCLCRYYNPSIGSILLSIETISKKINAGARSVSRAIEELLNKELILKIKDGKHNVYFWGNIFWEYILKKQLTKLV